MALVIFDTETSGFDGGIVELGSVIVTDAGDRYHFNERCKPHLPVTDGAFKVHGISNADVADCRPAQDVVEEWLNDVMSLGEEVIFCAHNLQFDVRMLSHHISLKPYAKFCSLELAREKMPHVEKHKLGYLYDLWFDEKMNAHSALDDCIMLERVLTKLLGTTSYYDIPASQVREPKMLTVVPFGKHKGLQFAEVPHDYLRWVYDKHSNQDAAYTAGVLLGKEQRKSS